MLIQESKAGSCDIRAGRRPRGRALLDLVASYQQRAGVDEATGNTHLTHPEEEQVTPSPDEDDPDKEGWQP